MLFRSHVLWADREIVQFNLPKSCSAKSKMFEVDRVVTDNDTIQEIQDNELTIKVFHINERDARNFTIDSQGTKQVIQEITASQETSHAINKISENIKNAEEIKATAEEHKEEFDQKVEFLESDTNFKLVIFAGAVIVVLAFSLGCTCWCLGRRITQHLLLPCRTGATNKFKLRMWSLYLNPAAIRSQLSCEVCRQVHDM